MAEDELMQFGDRFVRRMYCTSSKNYKCFQGNAGDDFTSHILWQPLPHFLWVTEFIPIHLWGKEGAKSVYMEVVLDATAGKRDRSPFVWVRGPKKLLVNLSRIYGNDFTPNVRLVESNHPLPILPYRANHVKF